MIAGCREPCNRIQGVHRVGREAWQEHGRARPAWMELQSAMRACLTSPQCELRVLGHRVALVQDDELELVAAEHEIRRARLVSAQRHSKPRQRTSRFATLRSTAPHSILHILSLNTIHQCDGCSLASSQPASWQKPAGEQRDSQHKPGTSQGSAPVPPALRSFQCNTLNLFKSSIHQCNACGHLKMLSAPHSFTHMKIASTNATRART